MEITEGNCRIFAISREDFWYVRFYPSGDDANGYWDLSLVSDLQWFNKKEISWFPLLLH